MERRARLRLILVAAGALLGALLVSAAALLLPQPREHRQALAGCSHYFLIPAELICGENVYWFNPDGGRVLLGKTSQLLPMPRPRPVLISP